MEVHMLEGTVLWGVDDLVDLSLIVDSSAAPIAAWDDMYDYVETPDPGFVEELFPDDVFTRNEFNLVAIYSETGELIYSKYYDYNTDSEKSTPQILLEPETFETLSNQDLTETGVMGLIINDDQPIIVSGRPILDTSESMPSRGILVIGFDFSEEYVEMIQEYTELPLEYHTFNNPEITDEIKSSLTLENPFTYETTKDTIKGYYLVEDIFGDPALIVSVSQTREVYLAGQEVRREFLAVIMGIGFLLAIIAIVYADQTIIRKIIHLTNEVSEINQVDDLSARVNVVEGNNELSSLTQKINEMLEKLETSRNTENRQREAMEKLREESTLEIFEAAKKISYLVHNELERPLRSMKQVAYTLREEGKEDLAEMLESCWWDLFHVAAGGLGQELPRHWRPGRWSDEDRVMLSDSDLYRGVVCVPSEGDSRWQQSLVSDAFRQSAIPRSRQTAASPFPFSTRFLRSTTASSARSVTIRMEARPRAAPACS